MQETYFSGRLLEVEGKLTGSLNLLRRSLLKKSEPTSPVMNTEGKTNNKFIKENPGSRDPIGPELNYRTIRIPWKGEMLLSTPKQLKDCKRDLNVLKSLLQGSSNVKPLYFRNQGPGKTSGFQNH